MNIRFSLVPALAATALLTSCKSVDIPQVPGVTPYRMVIQQGNFISQEMVSQLKPGMTREQVRFILGTPLVTDIFHADRWDYVYFRDAGGKKEQRNLSVLFEKDRLARVIGDLMPVEGATPQSTGFNPLLKPEPIKPESANPAGKPAAKPPAEAAKAAPDPAPPAAAAPAAVPAPAPAKPAAETWEPTKQNWGSAPPPPEPEKKPAAEAKAPEETTPEAPKEKGFFGRMMEKIGL